MKAAFVVEPGRVEVRDVKRPECGEGEVVLKVGACAVCGTDMRIFANGDPRVKFPFTTGHEIAGTIEYVGKGVAGCRPGEKVLVATPVGCGKCRYCRKGSYNLCVDFKAIGYHFPGGFAEYMVMPRRSMEQRNLIPFSKLSFEEASLVEPLSCCVNGQSYLGIGSEDSVVVIGAGPIGWMHVQIAKSKGASNVILIELDSDKLAMMKKLAGADHYICSGEADPVRAVKDLTGGAGADVAIVCCSSVEAATQAMQMVCPQGRVSLFAGLPKKEPLYPMDLNRIHYLELSVYGCFASNNEQYREALELAESGRVSLGKCISETLPLGRIADALSAPASRLKLKSVIVP